MRITRRSQPARQFAASQARTDTQVSDTTPAWVASQRAYAAVQARHAEVVARHYGITARQLTVLTAATVAATRRACPGSAVNAEDILAGMYAEVTR